MTSSEPPFEYSNTSREREAWNSMGRVINALDTAGAAMKYNGEFLFGQLSRIRRRLEIYKFNGTDDGQVSEWEHQQSHYFVPANGQLEALSPTEIYNDTERFDILEWRVINLLEEKIVFWSCTLLRKEEDIGEEAEKDILIDIRQYELVADPAAHQLTNEFLAFNPAFSTHPKVQRSQLKTVFMIGREEGASYDEERSVYLEDLEEISLQEVNQRMLQPE